MIMERGTETAAASGAGVTATFKLNHPPPAAGSTGFSIYLWEGLTVLRKVICLVNTGRGVVNLGLLVIIGCNAKLHTVGVH